MKLRLAQVAHAGANPQIVAKRAMLARQAVSRHAMRLRTRVDSRSAEQRADAKEKPERGGGGRESRNKLPIDGDPPFTAGATRCDLARRPIGAAAPVNSGTAPLRCIRSARIAQMSTARHIKYPMVSKLIGQRFLQSGERGYADLDPARLADCSGPSHARGLRK